MATDLRLKLGPADAGLELSREEFAQADFAEPYRYERAGGRLTVMTPAGFGHQRPQAQLIRLLGNYREDHPELVDAVITEAWFHVDVLTDRIADLGLYLRTSSALGHGTDRVPELVVEIVSPGTENRQRDYIEKRAEYRAAGVREYLIVDPEQQQVTVIRWDAGSEQETRLGRDDDYSTPLLPGLVIPLATILC